MAYGQATAKENVGTVAAGYPTKVDMFCPSCASSEVDAWWWKQMAAKAEIATKQMAQDNARDA